MITAVDLEPIALFVQRVQEVRALLTEARRLRQRTRRAADGAGWAFVRTAESMLRQALLDLERGE